MVFAALPLALASEPDPKIENPISAGTLEDVAKNITHAMVFVAGPIVAIMALIGGFQIMTAGGREDQINAGKKTLTNAAIGFAIILLAETFVLIIKELFA